jgi:hypothetical protein
VTRPLFLFLFFAFFDLFRVFRGSSLKPKNRRPLMLLQIHENQFRYLIVRWIEPVCYLTSADFTSTSGLVKLS